MDKELELRNLNNVFYKQDKKRKYSVYHDPINNNLIVFSPYDDCDIDSVCNGICNDVYSYMINELNNNKNLLVGWSQVSGTTSDYRIYYDMPIDVLKDKSYKEIYEYLESLNIDYSAVFSFKYAEVKNGVAYKLDQIRKFKCNSDNPCNDAIMKNGFMNCGSRNTSCKSCSVVE
jgi:hypothetical protein